MRSRPMANFSYSNISQFVGQTLLRTPNTRLLYPICSALVKGIPAGIIDISVRILLTGGLSDSFCRFMQHAACDGVIVAHQNKSTCLSHLLKWVGCYAAIHLNR